MYNFAHYNKPTIENVSTRISQNIFTNSNIMRSHNYIPTVAQIIY